MKTCFRCGMEKSEEEFGWHQKALGRRRTVCKTCRAIDTKRYKEGREEENKERLRTKFRERKAEWVAKKGGKCEDCGGEFHPSVFDFHHIDETEKEYHMGQIFSRRRETIENEMAKCILLCANCHRVRHNEY